MRIVILIVLACISIVCLSQPTQGPTEAPTGPLDQTNGLTDPGTFQQDRQVFDEVDASDEGIGPLYNATSCRECHQNPASGGASQITETRVGHLDQFGVFEAPSIPIAHGHDVIKNRTLVNDRATCTSTRFSDHEIQERVPETETIKALRMSLPLFGDGYIEVIADADIVKGAQAQCANKKLGICGQPIIVPVAEFRDFTAVGRFGWKSQHASILSFTGDAYLNEMGVTSVLFPDEVTNEEVTKLCATALSPNTGGGGEARGQLGDLAPVARFIRALMPPSRDLALSETPEAKHGAQLFDQLQCSVCHVSTWTTQPPGTIMFGGAYSVAPELGNKVIHPFSDFLLHDVGTGDGIEVVPAEHFGKKAKGKQSVGVANKLRTPPLWGLRFRPRMLHDGLSVTFTEVIRNHKNEARKSSTGFNALTDDEKQALFQFLRSL